jgi:hypothetical protein
VGRGLIAEPDGIQAATPVSPEPQQSSAIESCPWTWCKSGGLIALSGEV